MSLPAVVTLEALSYGALFLALVLSLLVIQRCSEDWDIRDAVRDRFVLGLPWGTLLLTAGLLGVYYLLQGGGRPGGPVVVGFRSWSLWYPQGMFFSSFTHASEGHLMGNLTAALVFGSLAEYAWGHYPTEATGSIADRLDTPGKRIGVFVAGVVVLGIVSSLTVPGAVIGFSGLVFAFAGVALVTHPVLAVGGILGIEMVRLLRRAVLFPVTTHRAQTQFITPSWADVALQGHLFGLLVGVFIGLAIIHVTSRRPTLRYVWFAVVAFAVSRSIWAVYWFLGGDRFVLYRALGTALVLTLGVLVAVAVVSTDRPLLNRIDLSVRDTAIGLLVCVVLALVLVGVPYNLISVTPGEEVDTGIQIEDYTVTYVEDVPDRYIASLSIPGFESAQEVNVSGVVVASDERNAWEHTVSANRLAFDGDATVVVGDATWRETVTINRTAWRFNDDNSTYRIWGTYQGERTELYAAEPARSDVVLVNHTLGIRPADEWYEVTLEQDGEVLAFEEVPRTNQTVQLREITFERDNQTLVARHDGTEIPLAKYEPHGRN